MLAAFLFSLALFLLYRLARAIDRQWRRRATSPPPIVAIVQAPPQPAHVPDALASERRRSVAATVNGHDIRPFMVGARIVYRIGDADFLTLAKAEAAAAEMPPGSPLLP